MLLKDTYKQLYDKFDIIFLDPPYKEKIWI